MATTAGLLSKVSVQSTTASLLSAVATGGAGPYTYQWYMGTTSGFAADADSLVDGATSLAQDFSGLDPSSDLYFKVIATDSGMVSDTSAALHIVTNQAAQNQNQFEQSYLLGQTDPMANNNVISCMVGPDSDPVYPGQLVKLVSTSAGVPKVEPISADTDQVFGMVVRNQKNRSWIAGDALEIALSGTYIYMQATGAIDSGVQVVPDVTSIGGVQAAAGLTGKRIIGWSLDKAAAPRFLIRVYLQTPSFTVV